MKEESVFFLRKKELIIRAISSIISRDVKIENDFVTIPDIKLSKDFKNAIVFFTLINESNKDIFEKKLNSISAQISSSLFKNLELRSPIKIKFQKACNNIF